MHVLNIEGRRFGKLVALERTEGRTKSGGLMWRFLCDCGRRVERASAYVSKGATTSCGCLRLKRCFAGNVTVRFFAIYSGMHKRCEVSETIGYARYGGAGISVSKEWSTLKSFSYDMYASYTKHVEKHGEQNTTIDRIDNTKGYSKGNCRWATIKQQACNRKNNILVTIQEETKVLSQWVEELNLNYGTVYSRIKRGWKPEDALTTPPRTGNC